MKIGDILLTVNKRDFTCKYIESIPDLYWELSELSTDTYSLFKVRRDSADTICFVQPIRKEKYEGEDFECKEWNITLKQINRFKNSDIYFFNKEGVFIQGINYADAAGNSGVQINDVILKIDGKIVKDIDAAKKIYEETIADTMREKKILIEVQRGAYNLWFALQYNIENETDEQ